MGNPQAITNDGVFLRCGICGSTDYFVLSELSPEEILYIVSEYCFLAGPERKEKLIELLKDWLDDDGYGEKP